VTARTTSLRTRLAGTLGLFFLAGMIALYIGALSYARLAADKSYDRLLAGSALSIAETLSFEDGQVQVDIPYASLDMLSAAPDDRVFYRVVGPDRKTITGYSDLPNGQAPRRPNSEAIGQFYDARYRGEDVRFVSLGREIAQPGRTGWVYVQVGQTRRARDALARELVIGSLAPILLMTVLALFVVWFSVDRALRPLGRLSAELSSREPHELSPVVTPVPKEILPVAEAINMFMHRLSGNIEALRSFIADAAHQIRTPLAAIHAQAQVAEDGSPEEMRSSLVAVRRNAAKLTRLVNQMLSDATVQHRSDVRDFAEFDLLATVRQSVHEAVPSTEDSDVRLTSPLREAPIIGDRIMIGEVVKNLIQNALTHGRSEHGEVAIDLVSSDSGGYLLRVADRGIGIPPAQFEQVFERFARGGSDAPGAGLGLPIVRQAVVSHGGTISLTNRPGGGLVVEVMLPREARRT
jgi:two-component system sensor histidine kinase TctE